MSGLNIFPCFEICRLSYVCMVLYCNVRYSMNYLSVDSLEVETGHNLAVDVLFLLLLARDKHSLL